MSKQQSTISYQPTDGLSYDPSEEKYWSQAALDKEIERTFEICHGCRMCFKYCDAFPALFDLIDNRYDGDVRRIDEGDTDGIMDECFQCKLCEVQCPYTVRDGHEYQLDFPRLVHRHQALRARRKGLSFGDRLLGSPDASGRAARASLGLSNLMNRLPVSRWLMEKALGIHREKLLPEFASKTFEAWADGAGLVKDRAGGEVVLFETCYVQHNEPQIGRDTVDVLKKNGVDVRCTTGFRCCGMPAWEHGDLESLRRQAHENLKILLPFVETGTKVLVINPTCSMMMRREYPELLEGGDREGARRLAEAVMDPGEYLWSIRDEGRFSAEFKSTPGSSVAYHAPCHLRAQGIGFKGRDLLRKIPGVVPRTIMECCGHNGTYAMSVQGFEPSQRIGKKAFDAMKEAGSEVWVSDCPLAAIQFQQHAGRKAMHPMTVLSKAYREGGFPTPVKRAEEEKP
jgi:Fe-S oxidoreductase